MAMDVEHHTLLDARIGKIECNMAELRQQNAKFEQWFSEAGQANVATATRLQQVADQVTLQQGEISALTTSFGGLRAQLQDDMHTGFGRLEALLSGRSRHE